MKRLLGICFILIFLAPILFVNNALSQETYPVRPISLVIGVTAGMGDTLVRVICRVAEKELGQPIIVENKPGGGGTIALNYVLKSRPDGYTLGGCASTLLIVLPHIRELPYNVLTDITDIATVCNYPFGLCVKADAPWNSYEDVLAYARKNPGKFTYATFAGAPVQHVCMERIAMKEGIKWTAIPFKGGGESVAACLGGHTDAVAQGSIDLLPHINAGKLKLLLALNDKKWPQYPNVPCILEKGYNFHAMSYISFVGPKNLPESIRQKLENVFKKAVEDPSVIQMVNQFGLELACMGGKEYSALWRQDYDEMGRVLKAMGMGDKK